MHRILALLLPALSTVLLLVLGAAPGARADDPPPTPAPAPVEPYARYEPQTTCSPQAKPGTVAAQRWAVATYGGRAGGISRACGGSLSEHKEGRAFDWTLDARRAADRAKAQRYLTALFATGPSGERAELARRMGVMYVIWNDRMYASYRQFGATAYVNAACRGKALSRCSATLRHRDHVHVSLSKAGGAGRTSWYVGRVSRAR